MTCVSRWFAVAGILFAGLLTFDLATAQNPTPLLDRKPVSVMGWGAVPPEGPGWVVVRASNAILFGNRHADFHTSIATMRISTAAAGVTADQLIARVHPETRSEEPVPRERITEWEAVVDSGTGAISVRFRFAFEDHKGGTKGRTLVCRGQGIVEVHPDYPFVLECIFSERAFSGDPMIGPGPASAFLADVRAVRPVRLEPSTRTESSFGLLGAGAGSLWLYQQDPADPPKTRELLRLDPLTMSVQARIPIPWEPVDIQPAGDVVWIASVEGGRVALVDVASQKVSREFRCGKDVSRLAPVAGGAWVSNSKKGELWKLDRTTGKALRLPLEGAKWSMAILKRDDLMWVTVGEAILALDPVTGERRGPPIGTASGPRALAWGNDALWVLCWTGKCVQRVDPVARRVTATIPLEAIDPRSLFFVAGSLWVVDVENDWIVRIDPVRQVAESPVVHPGVRIGAVDLNDRLWIFDSARKIVGALMPS